MIARVLAAAASWIRAWDRTLNASPSERRTAEVLAALSGPVCSQCGGPVC